MLQYSNDSGLPETYRIALAVSVAFLAHTLLMATFSFELPEHNHNPVTVSVQLTPQGSVPSRESTPSQASQPARATPFVIDEAPAPQPNRSVPTTSAPQPRAVPEPESSKPKPEPQSQPEAQSEPEPSSKPSSSAPDATASSAGEQSREQDKVETEAEVTVESEAPTEESSYISLLSQTISQKAEIPALDDVQEKQVLSVEVELNLMSNGALVGARVTKSSGNDGLDQRVYRAALAASPYPEPPANGSRRQRFRVPFYYKSR